MACDLVKWLRERTLFERAVIVVNCLLYWIAVAFLFRDAIFKEEQLEVGACIFVLLLNGGMFPLIVGYVTLMEFGAIEHFHALMKERDFLAIAKLGLPLALVPTLLFMLGRDWMIEHVFLTFTSIILPLLWLGLNLYRVWNPRDEFPTFSMVLKFGGLIVGALLVVGLFEPNNIDHASASVGGHENRVGELVRGVFGPLKLFGAIVSNFTALGGKKEAAVDIALQQTWGNGSGFYRIGFLSGCVGILTLLGKLGGGKAKQ